MFSKYFLCNSGICQDNKLEEFRHEISTNWKIEESNDTIFINSKENIYVEFHNMAGIPHDFVFPKCDSQDTSKIPSDKATLIMAIQDKWDDKKITEIRSSNNKLRNQIDSLIYKHNISHIKQHPRWGDEIYLTSSPEEEKLVENYKAERQELENRIKKMPKYSSDNYSIFIVSRTWQFCENINCSYMVPLVCPEQWSSNITL